LEHAVALVAASSAPVVNDPQRVLATDRATMMSRLRGIAGISAPATRRYGRAELTPERLEADDFTFPLLVRAAGFHGGEHFERVERAADLATTLAALPGEAFYAIAFADARSPDGWVRKYRVAFIAGQLYPIHYFSAAMAEWSEHRDEERRFLEAPEVVLGATGMTALAAIAAELGLDYGGVDFGRAADGRLIVFEVNATMALYPPDDDPRWDYRRAPIQRAIDAVRAMIVGRSGRT
jgi:glutathione synthase/RimK-type ligase-like ATP-grasp enzyme